MINYTSNFEHTLLTLHKLLRELRYDWIYRSIKGLSYFVDSSLSGLPSAINEQLSVLTVLHNIAFRLLRLGQIVSYEEAESLFSKELLDELIKLGLVVVENKSVHLDGYTIIPWLGFYVISTNPISKPLTHLTSEQYRLAGELMSVSGDVALELNSGCGLTTLVAAERFNKVFAFSNSLEAFNITLANAALNGLIEKIVCVKEPPTSAKDLPKADLVFASETQLPLPENIEKLFNHINSLEIISKLMETSSIKAKIIAQVLGGEALESVTNKLNDLLIKNKHSVKLFILSRNYISSLYLETLAQVISYQLNESKLSSSQVLTDLVNYYEKLSAKCIYLMLIEINSSKSETLEVINLASDLTSQDYLEIPNDIELVEKDLLILKVEKNNIEIQIDEIQKTIIELLQTDILLKEIAEEISTKHNISVDIAGTKTLEFCNQLFLQGLLASPAISGLRGQMRLMTLNVNKFANTLKTIGDELDSKGI